MLGSASHDRVDRLPALAARAEPVRVWIDAFRTAFCDMTGHHAAGAKETIGRHSAEPQRWCVRQSRNALLRSDLGKYP